MPVSISVSICLIAAVLVIIGLFKQRGRSLPSLREYAAEAVSAGSVKIYAVISVSAALLAEVSLIYSCGIIAAVEATSVIVCLLVPVLRQIKENFRGCRYSSAGNLTADLLLLALSFWLAVISAFSGELSAYSGDSPAQGLLHFATMQYQVFLWIMIGFTAACCIRNSIIRIVLLAALSVFILLVISDFIVMRELSTRVIISEIMNFTDGLSDSSEIVLHFLSQDCGAASAVFLLAFASGTVSSCRLHGGRSLLLQGGCAAVILIAAFPVLRLADSGNSSAYDYKFRNIIDLAGLGARQNYVKTYTGESQQNARNFVKPYRRTADRAPAVSMTKGLGRRQNIVLIFTESLSSYRSRFFGGLTDETPLIDRIAEKSLAFTSHHTNGFNTAAATFSLLTGLPYINSIHSYTDPAYFRSSLIRDFRKAGYHTAVMYTSRSVGDVNRIYRLSGFEETVDGTDPFFDHSMRLTFDSVPDRDLFDRALVQIRKREKMGTPFFTFIMTSTNHPPFLIPDARKYYSHQRTLTYTDEEIFRFVTELKKEGFFKNGIAVIAGDHRVMLPLGEGEIERFGKDAISRVPLIITGAGITPGKIERDTSHASVRTILEYLELDSVPKRPFQLNPFTDSEGSEDVLYQPVEPSDEVMIKTGNINYTYRLRGDESAFEGDRPEPGKAEEIEELIYYILKLVL